MKDYNQLFLCGLDYVQASVITWDKRRNNLVESYVKCFSFTSKRHCRDRHLALIMILEARVDEVLFEYRNYLTQQKEIDRWLKEAGVNVQE